MQTSSLAFNVWQFILLNLIFPITFTIFKRNRKLFELIFGMCWDWAAHGDNFQRTFGSTLQTLLDRLLCSTRNHLLGSLPLLTLLDHSKCSCRCRVMNCNWNQCTWVLACVWISHYREWQNCWMSMRFPPNTEIAWNHPPKRFLNSVTSGFLSSWERTSQFSTESSTAHPCAKVTTLELLHAFCRANDYHSQESAYSLPCIALH